MWVWHYSYSTAILPNQDLPDGYDSTLDNAAILKEDRSDGYDSSLDNTVVPNEDLPEKCLAHDAAILP